MTKKTELLHEGPGWFKIKKKYTKDGGSEIIFEAKISDNKAFIQGEKRKKLSGKKE